MKKIVITGGPCSGKTTTIRAIAEEFRGQVVIVPEVATVLLEGGFPVPGKDVEWSQFWQDAFQSAVLPLQKSIEKAKIMEAAQKGAVVLICDRGTLDGAAYVEGGKEVFCNKFNLDYKTELQEYDAVIHLESLAVSAPEKYGKAGNESRFESVERAQELDAATWGSWKDHEKQIIVRGKAGVEVKIAEVIGMLRYIIATS